MNVIDELYIIPDNNDFVLYAPLKRIILNVNEDLVLLLQKIKNNEEIPEDKTVIEIIDYFRNLEIIDSKDEYPNNTGTSTKYRPTNVTFLPTTECNLKCIYCYADSGVISINLPIKTAKAAIDFIIINALKTNIKKMHIGFLGGGEPFIKWNFIKEIVKYGKSRANEFGIQTYFSGVTNGILTEEQVLWITRNFHYLNISLDGNREIQNIHRPTKNNKSSYDIVIKTIKSLKRYDFPFSIRSTVSSLSVNKMGPFTDFLCNNLKVRKIHFEPLFSCGRCRTNSDLVPDVNDFVVNFKKCLEIVNTKTTELFCSTIRLDILTSRFCGALDQNFYITPDSYITACTEVSSIHDPLSNIFFIGKYNTKRDKFEFWENKRELLLTREVTNIEHCKNCIAKWHCAGACPVKSAYYGDIFNPSRLDNCKISRNLVEHYLISLSHGKTDLSPRIKGDILSISN